MLDYEEVEGKKFYFLQWSVGKVWVSHRLVDDNDIQFPVRAKLHKTEKGSWVLKPDNEYVTYNVHIPCGYRGSSELSVVSPPDTIKADYKTHRSPRGLSWCWIGCLNKCKGRKTT